MEMVSFQGLSQIPAWTECRFQGGQKRVLQSAGNTVLADRPAASNPKSGADHDFINLRRLHMSPDACSW